MTYDTSRIIPLSVAFLLAILFISAECRCNEKNVTGFFIAPGGFVALSYYEFNPSTAAEMDEYLADVGPSLAVSLLLKKRHTASLIAHVGFGAGIFPVTYGDIGMSYQYGPFGKSWAIGPAVFVTGRVGVAGGLRLSLWRINLLVYGFPKELFALGLSFSIGRIK